MSPGPTFFRKLTCGVAGAGTGGYNVRMESRKHLGLVAASGWLAMLLICDAAPLRNLADLRAERQRLADKPRRLIMNNDGCDCLYFPRSMPATPQNFLDQRTTDLAGTQVDAIAYCSISSGFGQFTHDTKVGAVLVHSPSDFGIAPDKRNIARDLIGLGQDPLKLAAGFCRTNGMECFWSIRMNDTHDAAHRSDKPYFLFPRLKVDHPEWLVGDEVKRTPYGRWSSVNYALPEVRDLAFNTIREVCRNYDVDGVELDWFRHLCYFPSVANGGKASAEECGMIDGLMRRIRRMTEEEGLRRGRPILISIRVPDSPGYCRDMGLDADRWMGEGLVDMLVLSGYFRLHDWDRSVEWGRKHGVKVLPCLTDTRVPNETRFRRMSIESYRARAANAWAAGADSLQLFNQFNPRSPVWKELGDPKALRHRDKLYFVTTADDTGNRWLADGERYRTRPLLSPRRTITLKRGDAGRTHLMVADDLKAAVRTGRRAAGRLHLDVPDLTDSRELRVSLNGRALKEGRLKDGWLDFEVTDALRPGRNELEFELPSIVEPEPGEWSLTYAGDRLPVRPWTPDQGSKAIVEKIEDGALFLADRGSEGGDYRYHRFSWGADPGLECVIEARVKVGAGNSHLIFCNGRSAERLRLAPDHIGFHHNRGLRWKMDTTDDFHDYRIVMKDDDIRVFVDGVLRVDGSGQFKPRSGYRNEVAFGASNSPDQGEAWWRWVKVRAARSVRSLRDVVVSVKYEAAP